MLEQTIEKKIIDGLSAALAAAEVSGVQIMGAWEVPSEGVKGVEETGVRGYLSVKVSPRAFDTYTVMDASFAVRIELNVRAEVDERGANFIIITDAVSKYLQSLFRSFARGEAAFGSENFIFSGFRLDGGDCGMDRERSLWTFIQTATIQGVINE